MSTPPPQHSLSLPTSASTTNERVLPTPSSSTIVRQPVHQNSKLQMQRQELEQQLAEKKRQLEGSSSGIGKNVLARQVSQIEEKIKELENQKYEPLSSESPLSSERLKNLERDLADYRKPPGMRNKKESFGQQRAPMTTGLDLLPSPTASSLLPPHHDSTTLLPLPPPPTGSTPTKRRSKVPNTDRRNTDIEFATEIGQGLLLEVRKMQALLQEKEEQLRTLENQKADLERAAEAMAKQMRQKEENEEKLKEETWNLELAKQELTISVTELQQNLNKANVEQNKLAKQVNELRSEIEQLRAREEKLNSTIEAMKNRHEQDMSSMRRHTAALQREKSDQTKQIEALTSELAVAKAQSRIVKHVTSDPEVSTRSELSEDQAPSIAATKDETSPTSSPPPSPKQPPIRSQAMEVETLKTSLAHAHRMVSNLRSNLHKEKSEKFELKKLLAESQEMIEQLQNDPRMWVDANTVRSSKDDSKRTHKTPKRRGKKPGDSSSKRGKFKTASSRVEDPDSVYSYSSISDDNDNDSGDDSENDMPISPIDMNHVGFTSLSSELSQSRMPQKPIMVDVEVNTDPVTIQEVLLGDNEALDRTKDDSLKQITDDLRTRDATAAAAIIASSILPTKSGVEIFTQTEFKSEGVESFVQTAALPSMSLSTQTEDSEPASTPTSAPVHISMQTEDKSEGIENFVQTSFNPKLAIGISTQTEAESEGIEKLVQTTPVSAVSLPTQTECGQISEASVEAEAEPHEMFSQTVGNESTETVKQQQLDAQHNIERTDAEAQTNSVEVKDAHVQYDVGMLERPSVLPLSSSQLTKRPLSDDEEDDSSFYYDATSDMNHSKPSSRNTLASLAGLSEIGSNQSLNERLGDKKPSTPRTSRTDLLHASKPTSIHAVLDNKLDVSTENEKKETADANKNDEDKKVYSKKETDSLIATAVAIALAKAKENKDNKESNRDSAVINLPEKSNITEDVNKDEEEDNGFGSVMVHIPQDKGTIVEPTEQKPFSPELTNGPSTVHEQEPEEQKSNEEDIPERPTSPPPSSLLSRALSPKNKGKMPDLDGDYQHSLHRTPASMSSMSTANTRDQLRSVTSSHFDNRSINATDPRMISLVTKTMIGDWLWKNTRKTMGGGISENKHQRYFWIHPYSRTLYWSNKTPGLDGNNTKAKSALIENITVIPNHSASPEGLPNVSLLIQTSHRQLRLTAPTMEKHDAWFESISHLLSRNAESSIRPPSSRNTNVKSIASTASSSLLQRASLRRLHDMFYQPSVSTTTATHRTELTSPDYEDDPLEDVRMCCNGKHHVSKLEREHNHRRQYRKRTSRIPPNH
ncbi:hypothetical protein G6F37_005077 [Rhizopus arrhizus]|nr:hypothetical protein G6F38_002771 [Rhizopus arrhizus]KAG1159242.1 hypothetical protein G6F37_005077 [Rhizopus arrhizus]